MTVMLNWSLESQWAKSSILYGSVDPKQLVLKVYCQINTILYDILSQPVTMYNNLINKIK
jgi:hypothetical protein